MNPGVNFDCLNSNQENICNVRDNRIRQIFFDLETSGTERNSEILQIAAKSAEYLFNVYVTPTRPISTFASNVNYLTFSDGNLMYRDEIVNSIPLDEALKAFIAFLLKFNQPCLLIGHNANTFDTVFLIRAIKEKELLEQFGEVVCGFADTLKIFKEILPNRSRKSGMFKLETLANEFLPEPIGENFHDATYDVETLEEIFFRLMASTNSFMYQYKTLTDECGRVANNERTARLKLSLRPYLEGTISDSMITKMASRGISFEELLAEFTAKGEVGLVEFLTAPDEKKKPRLTRDKKVLEKFVYLMREFAS